MVDTNLEFLGLHYFGAGALGKNISGYNKSRWPLYTTRWSQYIFRFVIFVWENVWEKLNIIVEDFDTVGVWGGGRRTLQHYGCGCIIIRPVRIHIGRSLESLMTEIKRAIMWG
jgi:hypothetical protein